MEQPERSELEKIVIESAPVQSKMCALLEHEGKILARELTEIEKQQLTENAETAVKKYLVGMQADINPCMDFLMKDILANLGVWLSFQQVKISGLEKVIDAVLKQKLNVAFVSTHRSYIDIGILPYALRKGGVTNVFYVGGENLWGIEDVLIETGKLSKHAVFHRIVRYLAVNLINRPAKALISPIRSLVRYAFRHSGIIMIRRYSDGFVGKSDVLFKPTLQEYEAYLVARGITVLNFAGRGRHRNGQVANVNLTATPGLLREADAVILIAIDYQTLPEDKIFSLSMDSGGSVIKRGIKRAASFVAALGLVNWKKLVMPCDKGYGTAYITFSEPIPASEYVSGTEASEEETARFHADATKRLVQLSKITAKGIVSIAALAKKGASFGIEDVIESSAAIVDNAKSLGANLTDDLSPSCYEAAIRGALDYMLKRGALQKSRSGSTYSIKDGRMLIFYANGARQILGSLSQSQPNHQLEQTVTKA